MRYAIEINLARKGAEPMWQTLVDDNDDTCWWDNEDDARSALVEEGRGENARLMRFDASGGRMIP
jgi:hypothetical protein